MQNTLYRITTKKLNTSDKTYEKITFISLIEKVFFQLTVVLKQTNVLMDIK